MSTKMSKTIKRKPKQAPDNKANELSINKNQPTYPYPPPIPGINQPNVSVGMQYPPQSNLNPLPPPLIPFQIPNNFGSPSFPKPPEIKPNSLEKNLPNTEKNDEKVSQIHQEPVNPPPMLPKNSMHAPPTLIENPNFFSTIDSQPMSGNTPKSFPPPVIENQTYNPSINNFGYQDFPQAMNSSIPPPIYTQNINNPGNASFPSGTHNSFPPPIYNMPPPINFNGSTPFLPSFGNNLPPPVYPPSEPTTAPPPIPDYTLPPPLPGIHYDPPYYPEQPEHPPQQIIKEKTIEEIFNENLCIFCNNPKPNLVLDECRHFCHLKCFKLADYVCQLCQVHKDIEGLNLSDNNSYICSLCSAESNIISCKGENCNKKYCFLCISNHNLQKCCGEIKNNLKNETTSCPSCLTDIKYDKIAPLRCPNHSLLCMKCWNLGVATDRCILGCELSFKFSLYCNCVACEQKEIKYLDNYQCPNECPVCDFCQTQHSMAKRKLKAPPSCASCGSELIEN